MNQPHPSRPTSNPASSASDTPNQSDQVGSARTTQPCISSQDVLKGQSAVEIEHNGNFYRLQTTRQGKLILTK